MTFHTVEYANREVDRLRNEIAQLRRDNNLLKTSIDTAIVYLRREKPNASAAWSALRTAQQRYPGSMPWNCEVTRKDCEIFEAAE